MKICFWSTSFQADNQAMAHYLAECPGIDVVVAMDNPRGYERDAVSKIFPFRGRLLDRRAWSTRWALKRFGADVLVVDNHIPKYRIAPRVFVLWHGFGWWIDDLSAMREQLRKHVGDVERPNANFRWQAFGDWDRKYRTTHSRMAPENVVSLGSAYSDLLVPASRIREDFDPKAVQSHYSIDIVNNKTVLLGLTWHHEGAFVHWGGEEALLDRFTKHVVDGGANVLVRMHDRQRYEPDYLCRIENLLKGRPGVQLKYKSDAPDSLVDVLVSDVMVSDYSSLLNAFYYTERPTIHIDNYSSEPGYYRRFRRGAAVKERVDGPDSLWKLGPDEIGGLRARTFEELLKQVDLALKDDTCCTEAARTFYNRYIADVNGKTRERIGRFLRAWVQQT